MTTRLGTRQVVLPLSAMDKEAPWWGAGDGALCAGLVTRPPRQATGVTLGDAPKVCVGSSIAGRRCVRGAPLCAEGTSERGRRRWPRSKWWSIGPCVAGPLLLLSLPHPLLLALARLCRRAGRPSHYHLEGFYTGARPLERGGGGCQGWWWWGGGGLTLPLDNFSLKGFGRRFFFAILLVGCGWLPLIPGAFWMVVVHSWCSLGGCR